MRQTRRRQNLIAAAGLYDRDEAVRYLDVEDLTIHSASEMVKEIESEINGHFMAIVRLEQHLLDIQAAT